MKKTVKKAHFPPAVQRQINASALRKKRLAEKEEKRKRFVRPAAAKARVPVRPTKAKTVTVKHEKPGRILIHAQVSWPNSDDVVDLPATSPLQSDVERRTWNGFGTIASSPERSAARPPHGSSRNRAGSMHMPLLSGSFRKALRGESPREQSDLSRARVKIPCGFPEKLSRAVKNRLKYQQEIERRFLEGTSTVELSCSAVTPKRIQMKRRLGAELFRATLRRECKSSLTSMYSHHTAGSYSPLTSFGRRVKSIGPNW